MPDIKLYDAIEDEFRSATQADWDDLMARAVLQSKFIVSRGLRAEWHAFWENPPDEVRLADPRNL